MKSIFQLCGGILCCFYFLIYSCKISPPPMIMKSKAKPEQISLPDGFNIEFYAQNIENARSMCLGDKGTLFVGTRKAGNVYALQDFNNDFVADTSILIAEGLYMPNGVAFKNGNLYVAEVNKVWRYDNIEETLPQIPKPVLITDKLPEDGHHGWKFIAFGPDNKLYIPVGAPCNICEPADSIYATILRMDEDGSNLEIYAKGVRNSVGFDWHPTTNELWFTENGRDWLGDDSPPCELNRAPKKGLHFGYPYCHAAEISDPKFGDKAPCSKFEPPAQALGPHVAPLGIEFYTGKMFPSEYHNQILIAEHGSWNRSAKIGYRIMKVDLDEKGNSVSYKPFAEGWLLDGKVKGRPVDICQLLDGSILVSDDFSNAIYRISYEK